VVPRAETEVVIKRGNQEEFDYADFCRIVGSYQKII
jgi:hypothetical protein